MDETCLDEELMAGYLDGGLPVADRDRVERHLAVCGDCLQEALVGRSLARSNAADAVADVPETVIRAVERRVGPGSGKDWTEALEAAADRLYARFVDIFVPTAPTGWQLATLRGGRQGASTAPRIVKKNFGPLAAEIEIEAAPRGEAHVRLTLPQASAETRQLRATLKRGARESASLTVTPGSSVLFEKVARGRYCLELRREEKVLGTYLFELKETKHER